MRSAKPWSSCSCRATLALFDRFVVGDHFQLTRGGDHGHPTRDQIIAGVAIGNILDRAFFTQIFDILPKHDFHSV